MVLCKGLVVGWGRFIQLFDINLNDLEYVGYWLKF